MRWTLFRSVASAGGSVVADPECLRLREEGDAGGEEWSDDIFFTTPGERGCNKRNERAELKAVTKIKGEVKVEGAVAVIFCVSRPCFALVLHTSTYSPTVRPHDHH